MLTEPALYQQVHAAPQRNICGINDKGIIMDTTEQIEIADGFVGKVGNELPSQHLHGRDRGEGLGKGADDILDDMDYEDALRRISELPPSERKAALREWKRGRKEAR